MNTAMEIINKKNSLSIGVLNESKKYFLIIYNLTIS